MSAISDFKRAGLRVLALRSGGEMIRTDFGERKLKMGDSLIVYGTTSELLTLNEKPGLRVGLRRGTERAGDSVVVEAIVAPHRASAGERIVDLALGRYDVRILGAHRHRRLPGPDLENVRLRPADKLLLEGPAANLDALTDDAGLVSITRSRGRPYRRHKAPIAILAFGAVVLIAAFGLMDIGILDFGTRSTAAQRSV